MQGSWRAGDKFLLDPSGNALELSAIDPEPSSYRSYKWHDDKYGTAALHYNDVPVMTYMYESLDDSTEERRGETYKVYHHLYTPPAASGAPTNRLMTKGPGGLFPHHRSLYYGFNRISYTPDGEKKTADTWHCSNGESQSHEKTLLQVGGPLVGRDVNVVYWRGQDGEPFAQEIREMSVSMAGGNVVVDFVSSLDSVAGDIRLDGDPQHAGFQFRASQDVPDKTKAETYYVRPDGVAEAGRFRNWSSKPDETEADQQHVDLSWHALSIVLPLSYEYRGEQIEKDQRYTVARLNHPDNPSPQRYSERDYGRFGSYFEHDLKAGEPLVLQYRVVLIEGKQDVADIQALSDSYLNPIAVEQITE